MNADRIVENIEYQIVATCRNYVVNEIDGGIIVEMIIEINKDIEKYQESVLLGLNARQFIYSALSLGIGGGIVYGLSKIIGMNAAAYIAIPVVAPLAMQGFYSFNGMSFFEYLMKRFEFLGKKRFLTYVSTEENGTDIDLLINQRNSRMNEKKTEKKQKKIKKK